MIKYENIKVVNKGQIRAMYGSFFSAVFMGLLVLIVAASITMGVAYLSDFHPIVTRICGIIFCIIAGFTFVIPSLHISKNS